MAKEELNIDDKKLIGFLAKYRIMSIQDTKKIYNSEWYYRKRIKKLVENDYIKRYKYYYIVLSKKGRIVANLIGKEYLKNTKNEAYMDRIKKISNIATITINSDIEFIPSWKVKDRNIFTETARKYIGELRLNKEKYVVYYLNDKKENTYIKQLFYDINKTINYENLIIFVDNYDIVIKVFDKLIFDKRSSLIIRNSEPNKELLKHYNSIDFYERIKEIYQEVPLVSEWEKADYIINKNHYVVNMIFIDTIKISELNWFFKENIDTEKIVDIITLEENIAIIKEILTDKCNLIVFEVGGLENEKMFK